MSIPCVMLEEETEVNSMKIYKDYERRAMQFFKNNPNYNAMIHIVAGIGIGFLLAYPIAGIHPVRWGLSLIGLSLVGHWWAGRKK